VSDGAVRNAKGEHKKKVEKVRDAKGEQQRE